VTVAVVCVALADTRAASSASTRERVICASIFAFNASIDARTSFPSGIFFPLRSVTTSRVTDCA